jgi:5-methylcytosine-specific restriction protein A
MPTAPPRACARCGKPAQKGRPCSCRPAFEGSTHPGSTRRWTKFREAKLRARPLCQWREPDGTKCRRPSEQVDHIIPLAEGGEQFDWDNTQALCHPHHVKKTTADALRASHYVLREWKSGKRPLRLRPRP